MTLLSRETLLQKRPRKQRRLTVPDQFEDFAGQEVILQAMNAGERAAFEVSLQGKQKAAGMKVLRERLLVNTLVDEGGKPLLAEEDIQALGEQDAAFVDWLFTESADLCGISKQDKEDLAGN